MKNIVYVIVAIFVLSSCQQNKIGFVDNGIVINDYQAKKDVEAKFQTREKAFTQKFDSIDKAFQFEVQKFQVRANKMSQKNAQARYEELGKLKQVNDQQKQVEAQELTKAFQTEIDTLIIKVKKHINDYGKANGYTYILGTSEAAATVLYGSDENDLTQIVLDELNAEYANKE